MDEDCYGIFSGSPNGREIGAGTGGVFSMRIVRLVIGLVLLGLGVALIATGNAMGTIGGVTAAAVCGVPLLLFGLVVALTGLFGGVRHSVSVDVNVQQQAPQTFVMPQPQYVPPPPPTQVVKVRCPKCGSLADEFMTFCPHCGSRMKGSGPS